MHSAIMICKLWDTLFRHDSQDGMYGNAESFVCLEEYYCIYALHRRLENSRRLAMTKTRRENLPNLSDKIEKMLKNTYCSTSG